MFWDVLRVACASFAIMRLILHKENFFFFFLFQNKFDLIFITLFQSCNHYVMNVLTRGVP